MSSIIIVATAVHLNLLMKSHSVVIPCSPNSMQTCLGGHHVGSQYVSEGGKVGFAVAMFALWCLRLAV